MEASIPVRPSLTGAATRHERVMELFHRVVELPRNRRDACLRAAAEDDADVVAEVRGLLAWDTACGANSDGETSPATQLLPPGQRVGRYSIQSFLGAGGSAVVYRALQDQPSRPVALKIMATSAGVTDEMARRFAREARVLAQLRHPGIAQIYDYGVAAINGHEHQYCAMELVEGNALTVAAVELQLTTTERIELLIQVCEAVAYAHQRGIVHRDLKPANLLVEISNGEPMVRVLDFGIARFVDARHDVDGDLTEVHQVIGTLPYMSPEQLDLGRPVDTRCDIYGAGVVGYELLTGVLPIATDGMSTAAAVARIRESAPLPLTRVRQDLDADLDHVFAKALAKDPDERYPSMAAFAADLRAVQECRSVTARRPTRVYLLRKFVRRNPRATALGALCLLVTAAGAFGTTWGWLAARKSNAALQRQLDQTVDSARFLVRDVMRNLDRVAGTADTRRALLERLCVQLAELRERMPLDTDLIEDHARALTHLSDALAVSERADDALAMRYQALELFRQLAVQEPGNLNRLADVSIALVKIGDIYKGWVERHRAQRIYHEAYEIDLNLVEKAPDSAAFLDQLAWSHDRCGGLAKDLEDFEQAEWHFARRLAITERLLELDGARPATRHGYIMINGYLAEFAERRGDFESAETRLRIAIDESARLAADLPDHRLYQEVYANSSRDLADFLVRQGRVGEAGAHFDTAARITRALHEQDPNDYHPLSLYFGVLIRQANRAIALSDRDGLDRALLEARALANSEVAARYDARIAGEMIETVNSLAAQVALLP